MSKKRASRAAPAAQGGFKGVLLACVLIGNFVYRLVIPAEEGPSQTLSFLIIAMDALLMIGLFGMRTKIPAPLFWLGLISGIGLFGIRMTSETSFWTGHLAFVIPPR